MSAETAAIAVAVAALVTSAWFAVYTLVQSRELAGSGFKTAEDLKVDLVALLAALRSCIYKQITTNDRKQPYDIGKELERIREFQTSASGYALAALAAERGSGSDEQAGGWRTLGLCFASLGGVLEASTQTDGGVGHWATEIETTLGTITSADIDWMAKQVSDLTAMVASLAETRRKDLVLRAWFELAEERRIASDPALFLPALEALKAAGVVDPDIDFWIAFLTDDLDRLKEALEAGADQGVTVQQVLQRHAQAGPTDT